MKRILVVEDNQEVNTLICRYLAQRSFECEGAASAAQCLDLLATIARPDLILMDLELPDIDGVELVGRIRALPDSAAIPVLVITGYQQAAQLERVQEAGADGYLFKPFSPRELLAKVQEMTGAPAEG